MLEPCGEAAVDGAVSDRALARAMLDVEAALARSLERAGLAPAGTGQTVTHALADLLVTPETLARHSGGNPAAPLATQAVAAVSGGAAGAVHFGATSQDVLDSALMLCARQALAPMRRNLLRACEAAATLADRRRDTLMVARTLGQPALPTTFGLKAAGWLAGLSAAHRELTVIHESGLAAQLGGAAGTLAGYGDQGLTVARLFAEEIGLADPGVPWHTERSRLHRLAMGLSSVITAAGKVAVDVVLLAQAEVGEVSEGAPGGSSAMPHKQNPVGSVLLVSAARRAPGLVATVLGSGLHEHERAAGSWHAEWTPTRDLLRLAGGAASQVADLLEQLRAHPDAMRRNLDAAMPGVMSEALAAALIPALGRGGAQKAAHRAAVEAAASGRRLSQAAMADPEIAASLDSAALDARKLHDLDHPARHLGAANQIIDHALAERPTGLEA
ncbi:MAG: lyase family protein [Micromonosporaceae bacterium]